MVTRFWFLNDIIFKFVFGDENNKPTLRALLNALLGFSDDFRIADLEILNPGLAPEYVVDKNVVLDIRAKDQVGRQYNIEVQVQSQSAYLKRVVYYLARLYAGQLEKGQSYRHLRKTIGVSLLDFQLFEHPDLHSTYRLIDLAHGHTLDDVLELHLVELPKFDVEKPNNLRTPFEKWLHILRFGELYTGETALPDTLRNEEGIEMAVESLRKACADRKLRDLIELREKALHHEATVLEDAREQGKAEGKAEGEAGACQRIARQLLALGQSPEVIFQATGIKLEEL